MNYILLEGGISIPFWIYWVFINVFETTSQDIIFCFFKNSSAKNSRVPTFDTQSWRPRVHDSKSPTSSFESWSPIVLKVSSPTFDAKSWGLKGETSWSSIFNTKCWRLEVDNFWYSTFSAETWSQEHNVLGIQKHITFDEIWMPIVLFLSLMLIELVFIFLINSFNH